ncbi:hypothetical protein L226DRAFT_611087 [Lentinus tigrinus ALCF2SS1-7]|uniref:Origin recognition complex subunit 6 n=1 Tax=Lentinus tigrinus ALCF2SS1-6 TaxID=1328759 RepID=A0A5C2SF13_9APHY|nr:hypothetical protein L227DRAFT_544794 [Lentinus tigrinus ALCF2SS1-6]RPD77901.1 hypothetical protein L226DRAFT_611087 [Lentinus tigrinus ALCF2SS1-7]
MSRQHDSLLERLCSEDGKVNVDTFNKAKAILHTAKLKTGPGSGYALGEGATGLPAICAYIAAEKLGEVNISEKMAQTASCLKPSLFKTTLKTVRSALAAAEAATSPRKAARNVSYQDLVVGYKLGKKALVIDWMKQAEITLMQNPEMRRRLAKAYDAITVAVFCWTLRIMGKKFDMDELREKYHVSKDRFEEITEALHEVCKSVEKAIKDDITSLRAQSSIGKLPRTATTSPTKQPTTKDTSIPPPLPPPALTPSRSRSLTRSPSKSVLRAPSADLSPTKTPSHKRKVAFDGPIAEEDEEEFDALATPSKRQKFSSPIKALTTPLAATPATPRSSTRLAGIAAIRARREAEEGSMLSMGAGPSTPRRPRTLPSEPSSTHSNRSVRSSRSHTGSAPSTPRKRMTLPTVREEPEVPRRRYRPVFADQQQWLKGDARLERELRPYVDRWRELMQKADGDMWKAAGMAAYAGTVKLGS